MFFYRLPFHVYDLFEYFCAGINLKFKLIILKMSTLLYVFMFMPQGWEWIIILVVVLLLFGGKKIPELMKGIGKGIRGFKDGMKEIENDIKSDDSIK